MTFALKIREWDFRVFPVWVVFRVEWGPHVLEVERFDEHFRPAGQRPWRRRRWDLKTARRSWRIYRTRRIYGA